MMVVESDRVVLHPQQPYHSFKFVWAAACRAPVYFSIERDRVKMHCCRRRSTSARKTNCEHWSRCCALTPAQPYNSYHSQPQANVQQAHLTLALPSSTVTLHSTDHTPFDRRRTKLKEERNEEGTGRGEEEEASMKANSESWESGWMEGGSESGDSGGQSSALTDSALCLRVILAEAERHARPVSSTRTPSSPRLLQTAACRSAIPAVR